MDITQYSFSMRPKTSSALNRQNLDRFIGVTYEQQDNRNSFNNTELTFKNLERNTTETKTSQQYLLQTANSRNMFRTTHRQILKINPTHEKRMSFVSSNRPGTSVMIGSGYYQALKDRKS